MSRPAQSVLIIDTDKNIPDSLQTYADAMGIHAIHASSLHKGLQINRNKSYDVILIRDILPDGIACYEIENLLTAQPDPPEIIIYTTQGNAEHAEHALKCGVWDYVIDPTPENSLPELLGRALRYHQSKTSDTQSEKQAILHELSGHGIIGRSKAIQNCLNLAARISQTDANVLITGESGTGKELFASAIHKFSSRSHKSLTVVDCASLPSTLVESILFGHTKGSFTGADKAQQGLISQSDGGTLFLDEIGEMPFEIQKKFLRVIQERTYRPVGSNVEVKSNFRLIAATNKDLHAMVKEGSFREDLLFRLRTFHLELPPLRHRSADITELAYYFRDNYCKSRKLKKKKFSTDYLMILNQYDWPGNVRELFQAIERSIAETEDSTTLYPQHLPMRIRLQVTRNKLQNQEKTGTQAMAADPGSGLKSLASLKEARDRAIEAEEKKYLESLLAFTDGNIKKCCEISELSRSRFYDLLKKYKISK